MRLSLLKIECVLASSQERGQFPSMSGQVPGRGSSQMSQLKQEIFPYGFEIALPLALPPYPLRVNLFDPEFHYP